MVLYAYCTLRDLLPCVKFLPTRLEAVVVLGGSQFAMLIGGDNVMTSPYHTQTFLLYHLHSCAGQRYL
eukprot:scaffold31085_cov178-Skeletonema_marinoi.AAC.3